MKSTFKVKLGSHSCDTSVTKVFDDFNKLLDCLYEHVVTPHSPHEITCWIYSCFRNKKSAQINCVTNGNYVEVWEHDKLNIEDLTETVELVNGTSDFTVAIHILVSKLRNPEFPEETKYQCMYKYLCSIINHESANTKTIQYAHHLMRIVSDEIAESQAY